MLKCGVYWVKELNFGNIGKQVGSKEKKEKIVGKGEGERYKQKNTLKSEIENPASPSSSEKKQKVKKTRLVKVYITYTIIKRS